MPGLGLGRSPCFSKISSSEVIVAEYQAIIDRFTELPDAATNSQFNTMVKSIVGDGVWAKLDFFAYFSSQARAESYLNWISNNYNCTDANAEALVDFVQYQGVKSGVAGSFLRTSFTPVAQDKKFKNDDGCIGIFSSTDDEGISQPDMGVYRNWIMLHGVGNIDDVRINTTISVTSYPSADRSDYMKIASRSGGNISTFDNGVFSNKTAAGDTDVDPWEWSILCNGEGTPNNRNIVCVFWGSSLTQMEAYQITKAINDCAKFQGINTIDFTYEPLDLGSTKNVCVVGDSIVCDYTFLNNKITKFYITGDDNSIANAAHTIQMQKAEFLLLSEPVRTALDYTFIQVGNNNLDSALTAGEIIVLLQDLIDTIIANSGSSNKILISTLTPCKPTLNESCHQKLLLINEAIMNGGATPITGVDYRADAHTIELMDVDGTMKAIYTGYTLHPNRRGRYEIAKSWFNQITM